VTDRLSFEEGEERGDVKKGEGPKKGFLQSKPDRINAFTFS
jgi:hypothetical protein